LVGDDDIPAGEHGMTFMANGLASVTDFYGLRSEDHIERKKLMIVEQRRLLRCRIFGKVVYLVFRPNLTNVSEVKFEVGMGIPPEAG
jgi:hypothetical protein